LVRQTISVDTARVRPQFQGPEAVRPMYLLRREVDSLRAAFGFSLPREEQWEAACRGGTQTLFFFGDELPEDRAVLESWVTSDLTRGKPNPFGLLGLFVGEWCADRWRPSYGKSKPSKDFVVRGGGSAFWPWQDSEWAFCVSAMRMPSSDLSNALCGARFVVEPS
jgi:formylglycine-generating enzyme required for sulfatase activity